MPEGPTQIVIGGVHFELDREEGLIKIRDFNSLEFSPATLAYVLQKYGDFTIKVGDMSHWRMIEGTTE
jgi:hypothetical protein